MKLIQRIFKRKRVIAFNRFTMALVTTYFCLFLTGCRDDSVEEPGQLQEVEFSISRHLSGQSDDRMASAADLNEVSQAIITITHDDGSATDFTNTPIDVFLMDGRVFTEKIYLEIGSYQLKAFGLANDNNEILFATPLDGSSLAANVPTPLPIDFEAVPEVKTLIDVAVVSVQQQPPSNFGFEFFEVNVVETIDFLINVSQLGTTNFIPSTLTVTFGEYYEYTQQLTGAVESIQVRTQSDLDYHLMITATGYAPYEAVLSPEALMSYETEDRLFAVELAAANVDLEKFQVTYGTDVSEGSYAIIQTTDGGYIIAAEKYNPASIALIIKLDATGNLLWEKTYGGSGSDTPNSIAQTNDGGYVVCGYTSSTDGDVEGKNHQGTDAWVFKLSATGELLWQKTLGGSSFDIFYSIQETTDRGYIMAGFTESSDGDVNTHIGGRDAWVVKLAADQSIEWEQAYGTASRNEAISIQQTSDDGYILLQRNGDGQDKTVIKLLPNGEGSIQWKNSPGSNPSYFSNVRQTLDGGFIMSCSDGVRKLNANGIVEWLHATSDHRNSVVQTQDGQYAVLGHRSVRKLNSKGQEVWTRDINEHKGEATNYFLYSMDATAEGGVVIAGDIAPESVQNYDVWVLKLDSEGNL